MNVSGVNPASTDRVEDLHSRITLEDIMSLQNQVLRAPNNRFYVLWRGEPVRGLSDFLYYFASRQEADEFLRECERQNQLADLEAFAT
jgi:hypothetical protein